MNNKSTWQSICDFVRKLFSREKHKCASGCKCKNTCCCESCVFTVAYDEKGSSDDSDEDIVLTPEKIIVK